MLQRGVQGGGGAARFREPRRVRRKGGVSMFIETLCATWAQNGRIAERKLQQKGTLFAMAENLDALLQLVDFPFAWPQARVFMRGRAAWTRLWNWNASRGALWKHVRLAPPLG